MIIVVKDQEFKYKIYFPESQGNPPDFIINTPVNQIYFAGTGEKSDAPDFYETIISIPLKAPSSTTDSSWSITWKYSTHTKTAYFDVKDPDVSDDEIYQKELFKLAIADNLYNAKLIVPERPEDCTVKFYYNSTMLYEEEADIEDHRLGTQMTVEIPAEYIKPNEYIIIWKTDLTEYYQTIQVLPINYLPILQKIRFLLDRVLKDIKEPQAYLEADLGAALLGGLDYINAWSPITDWTINNYPKIMQPFLVYAGGWYILNSQYMLESDLAFSYSGQSVSLDYDRTGPIESEISRLQEYMSENLTKAKKTVLRRSSTGSLGVTQSGIGPTGMNIHRNRRLIRLK